MNVSGGQRVPVPSVPSFDSKRRTNLVHARELTPDEIDAVAGGPIPIAIVIVAGAVAAVASAVVAAYQLGKSSSQPGDIVVGSVRIPADICKQGIDSVEVTNEKTGDTIKIDCAG